MEAREIRQLKNDVKYKNDAVKELRKEVDVLTKMMEAKDDAIQRAVRAKEESEERALEMDGELKRMKKKEKRWAHEKKRLTSERDAASDEADRLNQQLLEQTGSASNAMNGSMEDVVRLHNQVSEYRKEILKLKEDGKGFQNVVKAKDEALEEMQKEVDEAKSVHARYQESQNVIADLNRQVKELTEQVGGEHEMSLQKDGEAGEVKKLLEAKTVEAEEVLNKLKDCEKKLAGAIQERARVEQERSEAVSKMAEAVKRMEEVNMAEARRRFLIVEMVLRSCDDDILGRGLQEWNMVA